MKYRELDQVTFVVALAVNVTRVGMGAGAGRGRQCTVSKTIKIPYSIRCVLSL